MHAVLNQQLALEHVVELPRQAARQRLASELRAWPATDHPSPPSVERLPLRQPTTAPAEFGLTPREREVLTLVADGRTNRQIAQALFISDKAS